LARFRESPLEVLDGALTGQAHLGTSTLGRAGGNSSPIPKKPSTGPCCAGSKRAGASSTRRRAGAGRLGHPSGYPLVPSGMPSKACGLP